MTSTLLYLTTSHLPSVCRQIWQCQSFTPTPLTPTKRSKVKYLNFAIITKAIVNIFPEILHAVREAIDMKHIKQDFGLKEWVPAPGVDLGGGAEAKNKLCSNMVANILPTDTPGHVSKDQSSHVAYQIKGN